MHGTSFHPFFILRAEFQPLILKLGRRTFLGAPWDGSKDHDIALWRTWEGTPAKCCFISLVSKFHLGTQSPEKLKLQLVDIK
jgi:hypothetical protein